MTTTTIDPPMLADTASEVREHDIPDAPSLPARLLDEAATGRVTNAYRVGLGVAGLAALGMLPSMASRWTAASPAEALGSVALLTLVEALSLPVAALLTLSLPLPGLSIVLGVVNRGIPAARVANSVSRAFYRMGLLALGLTPTLLLYAVTGASPGLVEVGVALCYLGSLGLTLGALLRELIRALPERSTNAAVVLLGWAAFVALFGAHLMERLHVSP